MIGEVKLMLIKKYSKVYIWLVLCGDHSSYQNLLKHAQIQEVNEILGEKYFNSIGELERIYRNGTLILNPRNLEKI